MKITSYHLGPWEEEIGYTQSKRIDNRIIVSGTVGNDEVHKDMESQLRDAYENIKKTLAHDGATLQNVVKEVAYCLDIEELKKCQQVRKEIYEGNLPATTWVEVRRLYSPGHLLEIEVEAML